MIKKILSLLLVGIYTTTLISPVDALDEQKTYRSILKIKTYAYNTTNQSYTLSHIGSAVAIGSGLMLTNAHVVFDADGEKPDGYYEICRTIDFRKKPVCFTSGELLAYDESVDLALLSYREPSDITGIPLFQEKRIHMGAPVVIYGYPSIGGENISRSEGNIAGYQEPFYKIDGAIDHGNSGGGAMNKYGELLGIPSRVASDNAVFGYMIPITTIHDFLAKKTKEYTAADLPPPQGFIDHIRISQRGEKTTDFLSDANIKTTSMKKYGLKYTGKLDTVSTFLYAFSANNLKESSLIFSCPRIAGGLPVSDLDMRDEEDAMKRYVRADSYTGASSRYLVRQYTSLLSTNASDYIKVFDTKSSCFSTLYGINIKKHKSLIDNMITFLTTSIIVKKSYPVTSSTFASQLFSIGQIPEGISLIEMPNSGGDNATLLGYFSPTTGTGEKMMNIIQKKRSTINNYFLGGNGYLDNAPSDENIQSADYSAQTYQKLYEKEYDDEYFTNVQFGWYETKNQKKILIGTMNYLSGEKNDERYTKILIAYPYQTESHGKKEYYELSYTASYPAANTRAIEQLRSFFLTFEPVGTLPF